MLICPPPLLLATLEMLFCGPPRLPAAVISLTLSVALPAVLAITLRASLFAVTAVDQNTSQVVELACSAKHEGCRKPDAFPFE